MDTLTLTLLWFSAVTYALIGLYFLAVPEKAAASIGVKLTNATARTDVRATYGGMILGVAFFFAWAALSPERFEAGLWSMIFVYGGLALGRSLSIALGDRPSTMMYLFLVIELAVAALSVWPLVKN